MVMLSSMRINDNEQFGFMDLIDWSPLFVLILDKLDLCCLIIAETAVN